MVENWSEELFISSVTIGLYVKLLVDCPHTETNQYVNDLVSVLVIRLQNPHTLQDVCQQLWRNHPFLHDVEYWQM